MVAEYGWTPDYIGTLHPYWILVCLGWKRKDSKQAIVSDKERKLAERAERQKRRQQDATPYKA